MFALGEQTKRSLNPHKSSAPAVIICYFANTACTFDMSIFTRANNTAVENFRYIMTGTGRGRTVVFRNVIRNPATNPIINAASGIPERMHFVIFYANSLHPGEISTQQIKRYDGIKLHSGRGNPLRICIEYSNSVFGYRMSPQSLKLPS